MMIRFVKTALIAHSIGLKGDLDVVGCNCKEIYDRKERPGPSPVLGPGLGMRICPTAVLHSEAHN
jgi:hypothetical protein